jgi:hypothetical protein
MCRVDRKYYRLARVFRVIWYLKEANSKLDVLTNRNLISACRLAGKADVIGAAEPMRILANVPTVKAYLERKHYWKGK